MIDQNKADAMTFEQLCSVPNGPRKKFYLIKNFRAELLSQTDQDPRELGCDGLVRLIEQARR